MEKKRAILRSLFDIVISRQSELIRMTRSGCKLYISAALLSVMMDNTIAPSTSGLTE